MEAVSLSRSLSIISAGVAVFAYLFMSSCPCDAKVVNEHIYIVPAGKVDKKLISAIKERLLSSLPVRASCEILPQEKMTEVAYSASRGQYNAEAVLNDISQRINLDKRVESALIIADSDLFSEDLNFVFGAADPNKLTCIISLARLKNEFYGLKANDNLLIERSGKEAVHELGHVWGLEHCPNPKCVMFFSNSIADTDRKKSAYCRECLKGLRKLSGDPLIKGPLF